METLFCSPAKVRSVDDHRLTIREYTTHPLHFGWGGAVSLSIPIGIGSKSACVWIRRVLLEF